MSNYAVTGNPPNGSRNISEQLRREFIAIQNAIATKADTGGLSATSTTTVTIGLGTKTLTIQANKEIVIGMTVFIASAISTSNNMIGLVTEYNTTTGLLRVSVATINGSGTFNDWNIGLAASSSGVTLGNNTFTGYQNFAQSTIASSATPDIWAGNNQIVLTGTATVTGFTVAPQLGVTREIICQSTPSFTAGANMLISGLSSGETYTAQANDVINVRALTVSQFILTIEKANGKPNFVITNTKLDVMNGTPGVGSTNTRIRRFLTVNTNTGEGVDWTFAQSATLGDSVTILRSGVYSVYYTENQQVANGYFGISINSTQLSTSIALINTAHIFSLMMTSGANYSVISQSRTAYIASSSVLRAHTQGAVFTNGDTNNRLIIERIA